MKILVTGIGGPAGRNVSLLLLERGHTVIGADKRPVQVRGVACYPLPPARDPAFLTALAHLAAKVGAELLIPTVQEELPFVAAHQAALGLPIIIAPYAAVNRADDKLLTARTLAAAGVPVPSFARPLELHGPDDVTVRIGWPCLSKPRVGRGGRGIAIYDGPEQWPAIAALGDEMIIHEFAPGVEYAPNLYLRRGGGEAVVVVLEKTALREGRTGNAAGVRRVCAPDVGAVALAAARALGLSGPVDVDVRRRADGTPVVLEVNARFGANIAHAPEILEAIPALNRLPVFECASCLF